MAAEMADWGDVADDVDVTTLEHPDDHAPAEEVAEEGPTAADEYYEAIVPASGPYKLFITNLPFKITEDDVIEHFKEELKVKVNGAHLLTKDDGKLTGRGFVTLGDRASMITVLKLERVQFKGRSCSVELASNKGGRRQGGGSRGPRREGGPRRDGGDRRGGGDRRRDGGERRGGGGGGDRRRDGGERRGGGGGGDRRRDGGGDRRRDGNFGAFGSRRRDEEGSKGEAPGAFSSTRRGRDTEADTAPPPSTTRRTGYTVASEEPDAALLDKWSMKGGAMTTGPDGRPRLQLTARTTPLPEIKVIPQPELPGSKPAATSSAGSPAKEGGDRKAGRARGGGKDRRHRGAAARKATEDGWQGSAAHAGGRRGKVAKAANVASKDDAPVASGGGTMYDALMSDSDSD